MKAPLSRSVPLACDLLALSKSCDAVNDNAGKKNNQRVINRMALIGPFLGPLVYMGACPLILCGPVCQCVNLSDRYRVYWKWCFSVWAGSSVVEVCKVCLCHRNRVCQNHVQGVVANRRQGKDKGCLKVFKHLGCILAPLRPPLAPACQKCNFSDWNFCFNITFLFFFIERETLRVWSKILSLLRKCGFVLVSTGVEHKHMMPFLLNLSHFSAPRASCKPRQSKFKAIAMKQTSISILCSVAAIWVNMLKVLHHSELIMLETGHLEILSAFITNNQGMGTKV